jgi:N12 class adenine-specific DNA methylase
MNTLESLLEIEAKAAAILDDTQKEIDRRIRENEEKNRISYDEYIREQIRVFEVNLEIEKKKVKDQYQAELDEYCKKISCLNADIQGFSVLFNKYLEGNEET